MMAGQTATLFRARFRAFQNAARGGTGAFRPAVVGLALLAVAVIVAVGHLAAPSLLAIPESLATPDLGGRSPVRGEAALEAAFWLNALLTAYFSFRVMESLFRSEKIRALELLPVKPVAIFSERLINGFAEGTLLGLGAGILFLPLLWHGEPLLAMLCIAMGIAAAVFTAAVTIGVNAWLGVQYGGSSGLGDGYGGHGGAFIYAPMVSLAMSMVCLFLLQLGVREVLHDGRVTNAFWLATGVAAGIAAVTLLTGARQFIGAYHLVVAFFREADEIGFRAVMDYQESAWRPARFEGLLDAPARFVFRRHVSQFGRRFPIARSVVVLGAVAGAGGAAFLSPEAFPAWAVALLPAALVTVLERPFGRLDDETLGEQGDELMPLGLRDREVARGLWTLFEVGRVALPYAAVVTVARAVTADPVAGIATGLASAAAALGVAAAVAIGRRAGIRAPAATTAIAVATCALLGGALVVSIWAGLTGALLLCVAGFAATFTLGSEGNRGIA